METSDTHRVVIVGGGFGGLHAARALREAPARVTLVDRRNFHLFQPLLYQVATGGLSPGDIASPLRSIFKDNPNTTVLQAELSSIDPEARTVLTDHGELPWDSLVVAAGVQPRWFGDGWEELAPGLKSLEDALEIRRRVLGAFEAAERCDDEAEREGWLRFVVIGAGPTGVELAGALAELAHGTMRGEFRHFDSSRAEVLLVEAQDRVLTPYPPELSRKARQSLERLGVQVHTGCMLEELGEGRVQLKEDGESRELAARTVLWAAGMEASPLAKQLQEATGCELDGMGRVIVDERCRVPGQEGLYVIGDLANFEGEDGEPLPGLAPVAMQQGDYVGAEIAARAGGREVQGPFRYRDKGNMAVIGRNAAVVQFAGRQLHGYPAWLAWLLVHIWYLIGFDNKLVVMSRWAVNYMTRKRGARLITRAGGDG